MNNILKEVVSRNHINDTPEQTEKLFRHNCCYDIIDKSGDVIVSKRDRPCFSEIFNHNLKDDLKEFNNTDGKVLNIYALSKDSRLSEDEILFYINEIRKFGYHFNFQILKDYDLNGYSFSKKFPKPEPEQFSYYPKQTVYLMQIEYDKHKYYGSVKILAHLFRLIYEYNSDVLIKETIAYKKKYPKYSFLKILGLIYIRFSDGTYVQKKYNSRNYSLGHTFFSSSSLYNINFNKYKKYLNKSIKDETKFGNLINYTNYEFIISVNFDNKFGSKERFPLYNIPQYHLSDDESIESYIKRLKNVDWKTVVTNKYPSATNVELKIDIDED